MVSPPNTPLNSKQLQYQRRLARQRQLELMEAAASGTAPTMELHVSSFPESEGSFLRSRVSTERPNVPVNTVPNSRTTTSSIFDQRRETDATSSLNLMDHDTGIYQDSSSTSVTDAFRRQLHSVGQFFRPSRPVDPYDASAADSDFIGYKPPTGPSRVSPVLNQLKTTLADPRKRSLLLAVVAGIVVITITVLLTVESSNGNTGFFVDREKALRAANDIRFNEIMDHIILESVSHTKVFLDMHSPEHYALRWIAYSDPAQLDPADPMLLQRYALAVFFYSSFITFQKQAGRQKDIEYGNVQWEGVPNPGWIRKDFWLTKQGHCHWYGVQCEPKVIKEGDAPRVQYNENAPILGLNLTDNHVVGVLPPEFKALEHLKTLDLSHNRLEGNLPWQLSRLFRLEHLWLHQNSFTGTVPNEISFLEGAKELRLGNNKFSGRIPSELGRLYNLNSLALDNNRFTGSIPDLHRLQRLSALYLNNNELTGYFPFSVARMTSLFELYLNDNKLTGTLPPELATVRHLRHMHLENNQIRGSLPHGMFLRLHHLEELTIQNNLLSGPLPGEMGSEHLIRIVRLDNNQIRSTIPASWDNMTSLEILHLQNNHIYGSLPSAIGTMSSVRELWLNHNELSGNLPTEIGLASELRTLYLEENKFVDRVPSHLGLLQKLQTLRMHRNDMKGYMPDAVCYLAANYSLRTLAADCRRGTGKIMKCDCCSKCY